MKDPTNRPPEDLALFLDAARAIPPLAPAAKSALLSRILVGIDAPPDPSGGGGSGGEGPAPSALPAPKTTLPPAPWARPLTASLGSRLAGLLVVFAVGGVAGAIADRALRGPEIRTIYVDRPVASAPSPAPAGGAEASDPSRSALTAIDAPAPPTPAIPPVKSPAQPIVSADPAALTHAPSAAPAAVDSASAAARDSKDVDLAAERSLLERARSALARGNVSGAIEALGHHAAEFPRGRLSEEREAIWIQALAAGGRTGEARQRLARYKASFPRSFSLPALEAALGEP